MFRFERLDIWQRSVKFAGHVYDVVKGLPPSERFGLAGQLARAAASIGGNIAEGSSRTSKRDFSRFLEIAYGSLCEVVSHSWIARSQGMVSSEEYGKLYSEAEELGRMLTAFRSSLGKWKTGQEADV